MAVKASKRLIEIAEALPLHPGMRVLEIGCGPGVLARLIVERMQGEVFVLGIDRSATAIAMATASLPQAPYPTALAFRQVEAEHFTLADDEAPFDLAIAIRVGAFDGRHPEAGRLALHAFARRLPRRRCSSSTAAIRCVKYRSTWPVDDHATTYSTNLIENHSPQTRKRAKCAPCRCLSIGYSPHVEIHVERVETCAIIA